jgi:membrane protein required for colicin V production
MESHGGLNNLDLVVIGIVVLSGLLALMRGFTREIFSLIAWTGAYFAASHLYHLAVPTMHAYVKNDKGAEWAAMAAVFFVALLLLMIVGSLVASLIKGRALTIVDRSLGFVYGLARGVLVVSLVYLGAVMMLWPDIDKPPAPIQTATTEPGTTDRAPPAAADKDHNAPPDLLMQAKTRPILAFGANKLMAFVPQDMIDKSLKKIEEHKEDAEKEAAQKTLDRLSTPMPPQKDNSDSIDINRIQRGSQP